MKFDREDWWIFNYLRDAWLKAQGFTVLRFWNNDILQQTDVVLESIRQTLLALSPGPSPNGRGA